jgi:hypothetical protein
MKTDEKIIFREVGPFLEELMSKRDEGSDSDIDARFTADRFIPARNGPSMNSIYSVIEEARAQTNQSPEPNKGM